jgi:anti-sigma regulatory factor (Ser/Thr protein kinase)
VPENGSPGPGSTAPGGGFRLRIGGGPRAAGRARHELARLRDDLDPPLLESVRLLVTELVANSVRHAGAASVELVVHLRAERVRVEIANRGSAFTTRPLRHEGLSERGWGLFLVERLSDDWGIAEERGHQRVWFEIRRG